MPVEVQYWSYSGRGAGTYTSSNIYCGNEELTTGKLASRSQTIQDSKSKGNGLIKKTKTKENPYDIHQRDIHKAQ